MYACVKDTSLYMCTCGLEKRIWGGDKHNIAEAINTCFCTCTIMYACVKDTSLYMRTCGVEKRICQATLVI